MKKIVIRSLIVFILLLPIILPIIIYGYFDYKKAQRLNPNIYPNFRKIENYCIVYIENNLVDPEEYKRCSKIVDLIPREDYSTEEWYKIIQQLGFEQPKLYLSQPASMEEHNQAMDENKKLLEMQGQILEKTILNSIEETIKETQHKLDQL